MGKKKKVKALIHIEYTRAYHELLKYEDVLDIELDKIYQTYLRVLSKIRSYTDLNICPQQKDIDNVILLTMNLLEKEECGSERNI